MICINYLIKNTNKPEGHEDRRLCYLRNLDQDESIEYFPKLTSLFVQPKPNEAIFFVDADCQMNGLLEIPPRKACSYESAAYKNPDRDIFIVHLAPFGVSTNHSLWPESYRALLKYSNIHFVNARLDDLTNNPRIEAFLAKQDIFRASFAEELSDLARLLLVQRYGGIYMDSDIIIFKKLSELGTNWLSLEHDGLISNCIFHINNYGDGQLFTHQYIE